MTDDRDPTLDVPPRRFGKGALAATAAVLAIAGGMTHLGVRDASPVYSHGTPDAEPRLGEPAPTPTPQAEWKMAGPKDAIPQLARNFDPDMATRNAGILGMLEQESGHFLASPHGGAFATGNDDEDVWGGLTGTEIGEAYGVGGLGLVGTGRGGGGSGEGTIGLGNTGLIGKGGGGGTGSGYGGRGHIGGHGRMSRHMMMQPLADAQNNEDYESIAENGFVRTGDDPQSTFSIDVDTASYSNMRRYLAEGQLPPTDAVRIEELVNYFDYDYEAPTDDKPFAVHSEVAPCPWNERNLLVRLGIKGQAWDKADLPARNFVFLVDVSGSMKGADRLPLVKQSLGLLVDDLRPQDRVGIVVYAGASGMVLAPTPGTKKDEIRGALARLESGGSTNGGAGIELAYRLAARHFVEGGANRVILATDGDFNVGTTGKKALVELIEKKRETGVFLSVLGVGRGNLQDAAMESLADKGNGNYAYLDSIAEAKKVLVDEAAATLVTIAKDVKIQVELDPSEVESWRLVGYENRKLAHADFTDDTKDAGEIGAGHTVTALYEIVPRHAADARTGALMKVGLRWKAPTSDTSTAMAHEVGSDARSLAASSDDFRLASAAAQLGMLLRGSTQRGDATWASTLAMVEGTLGETPTCERAELAQLVVRAAQLSGIDARATQRIASRRAPAQCPEA